MIYILIPANNRVEYTVACIEMFKKQTVQDFQIIVIDDGSTDNTEVILKEKFKDITILKGDGNLWCMGSFAKAIDYVRTLWTEGDYVLTQNQDAKFNSTFIETLLRIQKNNPKSIVGSVNFKSNQKEVIYHNHILKSDGIYPNILTGDIPEVISDTYTLTTRGTLFPKEVFDKVRNFSKLFPHYCGDYDLVIRAKKFGFNPIIARDAISYSWDDNKGMAWKIKHQNKVSFKDIVNLFFSKKSSSNIYFLTLFTILDVPFPNKIYGLLKVWLFTFKFFFWNYLIKSILFKWKKD